MKKLGLFIPTLVVLIVPLMSQQVFAPQMVKQSGISREDNKVFSNNREFCGLIEYSTGNPEFIPIDRFILKDNGDMTIYEKTNFGHTLIDISNNGDVVGIDFDGPISGSAELHFYNSEGIEIGRSSVGFLRDRCFSTDGSLYCVNDGKHGLKVLKLDGKESFNLGTCNWFSISFDGKYIAITKDTEIVIFERGTELVRIPLQSPFVRQIEFSDNGSLLGYIDNKNLYLYRIQEQKPVFEYNEKEKQLKLVSFDITSENSAVLIGFTEDKGKGAANRHSRGFISLFGMNGESQWKGKIEFTKWNAYIPKVSFTGNRTFMVTTVDNIYEYQF